MSYSSDLKTEATETKLNRRCCILAELAALIHSAGSIDLGGRRLFGVTFVNENEAVIRHIQRLLRKFNDKLPIRTTMHEQKRHRVLYTSVLPCEEAGALLSAVGVLVCREDGYGFDFSFPGKLLRKPCCRKSFLRGVFLGCGSVSDIRKGYQTDLVFHQEEFARRMTDFLAEESIPSSVTKRRSHYVVYIKDSAGIERLLSAAGAGSGVLDIENQKFIRELTNNANRAVNCDTANTMRTVNASARQCAAIEKLERCRVLPELNESLRRAAEVRMEYRDASLDELCLYCGDGVTKSGMNHRLRRLIAIADSVTEEGD
ncbi:MAG: DNA-binding protein WhiA [Eubacteriales bacterium]|nr:DNA-binding protein WhiA [Eubacteriales bacterium]